MKIYITHYPCTDGNTASWVTYLHDPYAIRMRESHGGYDTTKKLLDDPKVSKMQIVYVDICPPRELLVALHDKAASLEVWDHHKTAAEDCGDLPYAIVTGKQSAF